MHKKYINLFLFINFIFTIYLFFFKQFNSNFLLISGDHYDGVASAILTSHWDSFFSGFSKWNTQFFFYPIKNSIGYTDSFFINGLFASIFRIFNLDIFLSFEFSNIIIKSLGFISMYYLLCKFYKSYLINICLASTFTLYSPGIMAGHPQLYTVAFAPFLTLLLLKAIKFFKNNKKKSIIFFTIAFLFLGMWLMTNFYMSFYYLLFLLFVLILFLITFKKLNKILFFLNKNKIYLFFIILIGFLTIIPFLITYLPIYKETNGFSLIENFEYTQKPFDLINFGEGSLLWGNFYSYIKLNYKIFQDGEHIVGYPFFFLLLFLIGGINVCLIIKKNLKEKLIFILFLSSIFFLFLVTRFGSFSLWITLCKIIPGASSARVAARIFIFLTFPMTIIIASYLNVLQSYFNNKFLIFIICIALIFEQFNTKPYVFLNRLISLNTVNNISKEYKNCETFFLVNPAGWEGHSYYEASVPAMLIAESLHIPTLLGISSASVKDYNLYYTPDKEFETRVINYAKKHQVTNLCKYDLKENKWSNLSF
jgi:hypothetical protein